MRFALASVLGSIALAVAVAGAADAQAPNRCEAAKDLVETQRAVALAQLKKALDDPGTRACAVAALKALQPEPAATPTPVPTPTHCDAAETLAQTEELRAQARKEYEAALGEAHDRTCAVTGLVALSEAEGQDGARLTVREVRDEVWDFVAGTAWAWVVGLAAAWGLVFLILTLFPPSRIRIRAPSGQEELAKGVLAAATAAGGQAPGPARLVLGGGGGLPDGVLADVSSLLRVPAAAPLTQLIKLVRLLPTPSTRLFVESATAGGWSVVELQLRRPWRRRKAGRIPLPLGHLDADGAGEVLSLAAGAWLVVTLATEDGGGPIRPRDDEAAVAHACFRAGANRQAAGDPATARACYQAMPVTVGRWRAPLAWAGARLNEMELLAFEHRWDEAVELAGVIGDFPDSLGGEAARFPALDLADLRRRRRYMVAAVCVDRWFAVRDDQEAAGPAEARARIAVDELEREIADAGRDDDEVHALRVAMELVALCFAIATTEQHDLGDVRRLLVMGGRPPHSARGPLSGAVYYDAACAAALLADRAERADDPDVDAVNRSVAEAVRLLRLGLAATPKARHDRVRAMIKEELMLAPVASHAPIEWAEITGEPPPVAGPPPTLEQRISQLAAFLGIEA